MCTWLFWAYHWINSFLVLWNHVASFLVLWKHVTSLFLTHCYSFDLLLKILCDPILSVIIIMINKSDFCLVVDLFCSLPIWLQTSKLWQNFLMQLVITTLILSNRRVYTSYLDSVIEKFKGQLTCHACVSGQNASCVCAVSHILPS